MDGSAHPKKAVKAVTPMMAQYLEMKEQAVDALLFFRMGDFYELFFEDAVKAAAALDITLTKRGQHEGQDIPMCGVPWHSHESYLARLIKAGFKVAMCEQTEDPAVAKKRGPKSVVRREIVRYVTPGTLTEDTLLNTRQNNYLLGIYISGSKAAIAWADMSTGDVCTRITDIEKIAADIAALSPREILIPDNIRDEWFTLISDMAGMACLTTQASAPFNEQTSHKRLTDIYGVQSLDAFGDFSKAEIAAMGALLGYVELTQVGQMPALKNPKQVGGDGALIIDAVTRSSLELTQTQRGEFKGSLFSAIDKTITGPGARMLGAWLSSPLTNVDHIQNRQNAVQYFVDDAHLREGMRGHLKSVPDMSRALSRLALGRSGPRDIANIRDGLIAADSIVHLLNAHSSDGVSQRQAPPQLEKLLSDLSLRDGTTLTLLDLLKSALQENLPLLTREGGFIAPAFNEELDQQRNLRDNARQVIASLEDKYRTLTETKSLKVKHNNVLGFFIETPAAQAPRLQTADMAELFIHRQSLANAIRFTTVELSELDAKISRAKEGALALELELFASLCAAVIEQSVAIASAAEALAAIDVFSALAELAVQENYTCPKVDTSVAFDVKGARHPVVEQAIRSGELGDGGQFIPNDCVLTEKDAACLLLVTGPNMAGKSTFLRQNALLAILAQMGSFVPAASAHIGIVDRVFSRVGASDDLSRGRSTFMVEMVETAAILNQATDRSLVVLDEIGRGTATFDGLSIAWAAAEHLHEINKCRGLFATHYHEMTTLSGKLDRLRNVSMKVREWKDDIIFLHEVASGPADRSYGVAVARLAGLPKRAVRRAEEVLKLLEEGKVHEHGGVQALVTDLPLFSLTGLEEPEEDYSDIFEAVKEIDPDSLTPRDALDQLYHLKDVLKKYE